jgi:hypothetical protein
LYQKCFFFLHVGQNAKEAAQAGSLEVTGTILANIINNDIESCDLKKGRQYILALFAKNANQIGEVTKFHAKIFINNSPGSFR